MLKYEKINQIKKIVPKNNDNRPVLNKDIINNPYYILFNCGKKGSGKSINLLTILMLK